MKLSVDLNADLGEGIASEHELLSLISSASIACGLHAGDPSTIEASIRTAQANGVAVGAHPSLNDRKNFGRTELPVSPAEVFALVVFQLGAFHALASSLGEKPRHIKLHGALYNMAARDRAIAEAAVQAVVAVDRSLVLFCPGDECPGESRGGPAAPHRPRSFCRSQLSFGRLACPPNPERRSFSRPGGCSEPSFANASGKDRGGDRRD